MTLKRADKAYNNLDFIHSKDGRIIRILAEYLYPEQYFRKHKISNTIVFYGSARTLSTKGVNDKLKSLNLKLKDSKGKTKSDIENKIKSFEKLKMTSAYYDDAVKLASMLSEWSKTLDEKQRFFVCTGGGPGMMEAANKGAYLNDSPSIGLNISLPFEQFPNPYITPDLNFEFHYFFMRKFWFVYIAKAIIALPGGYGTMDELMEILTLKQTEKVKRPLPIVLYGSEFWKNLVNFEYLAEMGMIDEDDLKLFVYLDNSQDAFEYITSSLKEIHNL